MINEQLHLLLPTLLCIGHVFLCLHVTTIKRKRFNQQKPHYYSIESKFVVQKRNRRKMPNLLKSRIVAWGMFLKDRDTTKRTREALSFVAHQSESL